MPLDYNIQKMSGFALLYPTYRLSFYLLITLPG